MTLQVTPEAERVGGKALEAAYRITQEALRNVDRHAQAGNVRVEASGSNRHLNLLIADDGVGFSAEDRRRRADEGHLGLSLVDDLARDAGGELHVESQPWRGTELRARLPVEPVAGTEASRASAGLR